MGILEVLTIIFVICKLVGVISWSWWFVFLPLIIAVGIYVLLFTFYGIGFFSIARRINKEFDDDF